VYLGSRPREIALGLAPADGGEAVLPESLRALGERQLKNLWQQVAAKKLIAARTAITVEAWPVRDDRSRLTWAFARWRASAVDPWRWLPPSVTLNTDPNGFLPRLYDPAVASDHFAIFADFMDMGIYDKPIFGDCVWVERVADPSLAIPIEAWLPTSQREAYGQRSDLADRLAYQLPQPARLNGAPIELQLIVWGDRVTWPDSVVWTSDPPAPPAVDRDRVVAHWPGLDRDGGPGGNQLLGSELLPEILELSFPECLQALRQYSLPAVGGSEAERDFTRAGTQIYGRPLFGAGLNVQPRRRVSRECGQRVDGWRRLGSKRGGDGEDRGKDQQSPAHGVLPAAQLLTVGRGRSGILSRQGRYFLAARAAGSWKAAIEPRARRGSVNGCPVHGPWPSTPALTFVTFAYVDPAVRIEAFRLLIPRAWQAQGGLVRIFVCEAYDDPQESVCRASARSPT
jgi:hypothetical protein